MKKIFKIIFLIFLSIILVSCDLLKNETPLPDEDTLMRTVDFISMSREYYLKDRKIDLYYPIDEHLPYVNVEEYLTLLNGVYISEEFEFVYTHNKLTINLLITYDEVDYSASLVINTLTNTIEVDTLDFFDLYLESTETDYGEGLIFLEPIVTKGSSVTYNLEQYGFDVRMKEEKVYLPFVIANLVFNQSTYFDTYYNGDVIYGVDTAELARTDLIKILGSSFNSEEIPESLKVANYNFMTFVVDYFYGLKADRNIVSANTYINKSSFINGDMERNLFNIVKEFDDLHTSHMTRGFYDNPRKNRSYSSNYQGEHTKGFYDAVDEVRDEAIDYFGIKGGYINIKDYEYLNSKTLIIYLLEFTVDTPVEVENIIKDANPEVENIIIDISFNTGGNLGAVIRMFTLMTDEEIKYHYKNPLNGEKATYRSKGENPSYNKYNYFVKTSGVTFSAANLTASIAKELGFKVIGKKSSGGAASISFFVFPTGSIIITSSNFVLTNSEYESIELGITPDILLNKHYNKQEILNAIK